MVSLRRSGLWIVGTIAITAGGLLGADKLEASFERTFGCGREFTPIKRRTTIDIGTYEFDNMALTRSVPLLATAEPQELAHEPYHQCGDGRIDSAIVGVRSSYVVVLPPDSDQCKVMTALETDLEASGWSVRSQATSATDGRGHVRTLTAERDNGQLDLSLDGNGTRLGVVADHYVPSEAPFSQSNVDPRSTFDCEFDK